MGGLCIIYTYMGGMEAVIWTDVTQVLILGGGAIISLFVHTLGNYIQQVNDECPHTRQLSVVCCRLDASWSL